MKFIFAKKATASTSLVVLMLMLLIPMTNASLITEDATEEEIRAVESAERICEGLEGAEYSNCIDREAQNYLDAEAEAAAAAEEAAAEEAAATETTEAEEEELDCTNPQTAQEKKTCLTQKLNQLLISEDEFVNQANPSKNEGTSLAQGDIATDFIPFFINLGISLAGTMVFIALLYAGYLLVFANDKEESIEKGKKILTYAVVGAIMVAISYALVFGVANLDLN